MRSASWSVRAREGTQEVLPLVGAEASAPTTATTASSPAEQCVPPSQPSPSCMVSTNDDRVDDSSRQERGDTDEEPLPMSLDVDASDRSLDRLLACFGMLDDAAPVFASVHGIGGAGVLLAIPALVDSAVFVVARKLYGGIGPAFYGLRTTVLVLLVMALLRIKRPEQLKERDPPCSGRLLGLDRAPEVKTLRRKLTRLAAYHQRRAAWCAVGATSCGQARATLSASSTSMATCAPITANAASAQSSRGRPPSGHAGDHRLLGQRLASAIRCW